MDVSSNELTAEVRRYWKVENQQQLDDRTRLHRNKRMEGAFGELLYL